ncbi:MAG: gliding motility lipoprotein GldH [Bacteroidota bacterium]
MSKFFLFALYWCLLSFLVSCDDAYVFEKSYQIENSAWRYANKLDYTFEIGDTTKVYNLLLEVDHSVEYAYQNCYFKIYTTFPSGEQTEQVLSVDFADDIGRWQGDCGGENCTVVVDLQKKAFFNALGKHTITLEQHMRKDPLDGIASLAIKLEDIGLTR